MFLYSACIDLLFVTAQSKNNLYWGQVETDGYRFHGEDMLLYIVQWSDSEFSYGIVQEPIHPDAGRWLHWLFIKAYPLYFRLCVDKGSILPVRGRWRNILGSSIQIWVNNLMRNFYRRTGEAVYEGCMLVWRMTEQLKDMMTCRKEWALSLDELIGSEGRRKRRRKRGGGNKERKGEGKKCREDGEVRRGTERDRKTET